VKKHFWIAGIIALLVFLAGWIIDSGDYDRDVNDDPGVVYLK
jgi:hypothetical protein